MKGFSISNIALAGALLLAQQSVASPTLSSLSTRGYSGLVLEVLKIFQVIMKDTSASPYAWDFQAHPDFCKIYMETTDGANCKATVECDNGVKNYLDNGQAWNVCYQGGRQYFTDDRIGDFSITFTGKDGEDGQGLTNPVLQLANIENWKELRVSELASYTQYESFYGKDRGPYVCTYIGNNPDFGRTRKYICGVPKTGRGGLGLDSNSPVNDRGYASGWCVAHVTQYQKPDPSKDSYSLEANIFDNNQSKIGGTTQRGGASLSLGSLLPMTLEMSTGGDDAAPVSFAYGDQTWDSNDSRRCKVGKYDKGSRQMDCGFTC